MSWRFLVAAVMSLGRYGSRTVAVALLTATVVVVATNLILQSTRATFLKRRGSNIKKAIVSDTQIPHAWGKGATRKLERKFWLSGAEMEIFVNN